MKTKLLFLALILVAATAFGQGVSIGGGGFSQSNVLYAATAGHAATADSATTATNAVDPTARAAIVAETNRAQVAEAILATNSVDPTARAAIVAETNRAQQAEANLATNSVDPTWRAASNSVWRKTDSVTNATDETARAAVSVRLTNTFVLEVQTNETGAVTNLLTTNIVRYVPQ